MLSASSVRPHVREADEGLLCTGQPRQGCVSGQMHKGCSLLMCLIGLYLGQDVTHLVTGLCIARSQSSEKPQHLHTRFCD